MTDDGLSADEQRLATDLAALTTDPAFDRRARIMSAVRAAAAPRPQWLRRHRLALASLAAATAILLVAVEAVAASADALPGSPNYSLRNVGEQSRLAVAPPAAREHLRISFAHERIAQVRQVLQRGDRGDAEVLLRDSRAYLTQAQTELPNVPSGQQGSVQNELNQATADEHQAESQLNQNGEQGQSGS